MQNIFMNTLVFKLSTEDQGLLPKSCLLPAGSNIPVLRLKGLLSPLCLEKNIRYRSKAVLFHERSLDY